MSLTLLKIVSLKLFLEIYHSFDVSYFSIYVTTFAEEAVVAECGGLLGLFLGFSFTTVINFVYRCMSAYKTKRRSQKLETNHDECLRQGNF